jgi:perosamine synthetase
MPLPAFRQVPLAVPSLADDDYRALAGPIASGWVAQGPEVAAFEVAFAARHGVKHALACSSGTTALHLILAGMGLGPGDEVIVPSFTWVACANAVLYTGATPVLVDVDPRTFNIDPAAVARALTGQTRAVMAVHLFGLCAPMDELRAVIGELPILEDAACAAGGRLGSRHAGSMGLAGAFSFHPRKTITTGEGGMVTTDDSALAERIAALRAHGGHAPPGPAGQRPYTMPIVDVLGFNYRLTDLQGALGRNQLGKLDGLIAERRRHAVHYCAELRELDWLRLPEPDPAHTYQSFVGWVDEARAGKSRNAIMDALAQLGVATRPGTHAIHGLDYYRERFGLDADALPGSRDADRFSMAIPMHNRLDADDMAHVIACLRAVV